MLKVVRNLINAVNTGKKKATCGNHWMEVSKDGVIRYYYHSTAVCTIKNGHVVYDNGGWGTSSTTRTINSYRQYYGE